MEQNVPNVIAGFVPLILISVVFAIVAHMLAKDKGRNVGSWTVLGAIPIVNMVCMWYFVGAANLRLEKKIDSLTAMLQRANKAQIVPESPFQ